MWAVCVRGLDGWATCGDGAGPVSIGGMCISVVGDGTHAASPWEGLRRFGRNECGVGGGCCVAGS